MADTAKQGLPPPGAAPAPRQVIPPPAQPAPVGGFSNNPSRGNLPIQIVAMIQSIYGREDKKRAMSQMKDNSGMGLGGGWGGQGT